MRNQATQAMVAASQWYATLASGSASATDYAAWQQWKEASVENAHAWQQLEEINHQFKQIPPKVGLSTLQNTTQNRRQVLKQLAVLVGVSSTSWYAYREQPWRPMLADYSTSVGVTQEIKLEDGTQLTLNTDTSINVQYNNQQRQIELLQGEILIKTSHHNSAGRDFVVKTPHGQVTALGTQFLVRNFGSYSKASLFEGVIKIAINNASEKVVTLKANDSIEFTHQQFSGVHGVKLTETAWAKGMLVVYAMPLKQFSAELSRYRPGVLRCDPSIAQLEISGAFPINNTNAVLETLASTLPVRIHKMTDYWVSIQAL